MPVGVRVLVVDDDPRVRRAVAGGLARVGFHVVTADDGGPAILQAQSTPPDLAVVDLGMPTSGLVVVRQLKKVQGTSVHVTVLSGRDDEATRLAAFDAGADDFVAKPYNPRVLMARVAAGHRMVELQRQVRLDRERRSAQVVEMGLMTRKLHAAAHTDVLTELPNRRYAIKRLEQEWADAVRLERPLAVLVVDIDHFKDINDRYGHDVGDDVLRSTASMLRARTRRADVVCRLGGEEFLVINVNSDAYGAAMCAERLRSAVESNLVKSRGFEGRVTISIGLSTRGEGASSVHELLKAADQAVYAAKAAGRNTVRSFRRCLPESA